MKALFNKVLPGLQHKEQVSNKDNGVFLYTFSNLREVQLKSAIGYLAMKIHKVIECDPKQSEEIFYQSFHDAETEKDDPLHLSRLLLNWIMEDKNIKDELAAIALPVQVEQAVLLVYESCKEELEEFKESTSKKKNEAFSSETMEWEIYRDIIYAATQRKLLLIPYTEIREHCEGSVLYSGQIVERADVSKCRKDIQSIFVQMGVKQNILMSWLLAISELATNCIKHANGGRITVKQNHPHLYIIVEDEGPGFKLKNLPNMTLIAGYSTINSMGQGFNLMMKMAEQIMLSNTKKGATLILKFMMKEDEPSDKTYRHTKNI